MENILDQQIIESEERIIIYAGFWSRLWALIIDSLIFAPFAILVIFNQDLAETITYLYIIPTIQLIYKPLMEYNKGQTIGKIVLKLKVVNYQQAKPLFLQIILRNIFYIGNIVFILVQSYVITNNYHFIGFSEKVNKLLFSNDLFLAIIMLAIYIVELVFLLQDEKSRSLHDYIGKTYVIKIAKIAKEN